MRKILIALAISAISLMAFQDSQTCQVCHPVIYEEYSKSGHRNASIFNDPVHKAVWDKHPLKERELYNCAKCHTPSDTKLMEQFANREKAVPKKNKIQTTEAIGCIYCHKISSIETHAKTNNNILTDKKKLLFSARDGAKSAKNVEFKPKTSWFGLVKESQGSPFHDIDFSNEGFYDGQMCVGCHSHKKNSHDFAVCDMDIEENKSATNSKENCISCHMQQVGGPFSTSSKKKTHASHDFAGGIHRPQMLSKYVALTLNKSSNGFEVTIKSEAPHELLMHPLRMGELRVFLKRDSKTTQLPTEVLMRVIANDGKPSMPWVATEILKNTQIQANETRKITYNEVLKSGDELEVRLGHYIVNPKAAKKLGLTDNHEVTKFTIFKTKTFKIK